MSPRPLRPEALENDSLPMLRYACGRAAHDLNNYLSGLLGYLSLIKERLGDQPDCARFLGFMEKSGSNMAKLLKALTDFGEPPSPDATLVDANAAVRIAVNRVAESGEEGFEPTLELDKTVARVSAAAGSLSVAVEHLLRNALEACDARPAPVTVRTSVAAIPADPLIAPNQAADGWVCIEVEDHGAGMDADTVRRCVLPFCTTKRATDQHGLGLALACSYVCAWGGGLDIRSTPGAGTTVSLYLRTAKG